jgi:chemotaxis protein MotB
VTLLLATFVVMYAVSTINSSKFQEMAESFSTAFMGRTTTLNDSGFGAADKGPFNFMPNPVHLPVISREVMVKDAPPALRQEQTVGDANHPNDHGQFLPRGGVDTQSQSDGQKTGAGSVEDQVAQRVQNLDTAFEQLNKSLAELIRKGQVNVSLQSLGVVIDINETLLFNSGKADLMPAALPVIDQIAKILADLRYQIQVNGFTDNVPIHNAQFDSNWDLSATRSISVVKRFVAEGIDPTLLVGAGFGEYHPIQPNNTVEGRSANRRVSIVVVSPLEGDDPARSRLVGSGAEHSGPAPTSAGSPAAVAPPSAPAAAPAPVVSPPAASAAGKPTAVAPTPAAPSAAVAPPPAPTAPPAPVVPPPATPAVGKPAAAAALAPASAAPVAAKVPAVTAPPMPLVPAPAVPAAAPAH